MASIPFSAVQNYLKQILSPRIEEQYAKETPFLANLQKNVGVERINNKFLITVVKSMHSGVAAVEKGATLPTGYAATAQVEIDPSYVFVGFSVDDQDLEMARESDKALANLMTINESQMRTALAKQLNRMFFQNGSTNGLVATASASASSSTTLTINNSSPNGDITGTKYFAPGMYVVVGTGAAVQISSVDSDNQVTLAAARSWSASDNIYIVGPDGTTGQEPTGLVNALASTGTFQTIARSANPWWTPTKFTTATTFASASRALEYKLTNLAMKAREYGKIGALFGNFSAVQNYAEGLQSTQRTVNSVDLKGGFKGLAFAGPGYDVPFVTDWDCPDGYVFGVDFSSLTLAQLAPIKWLELDGSGNILRLQGKATWEGFLKYYVQLGLRRAKGNFVLSNGTFTLS